MPSAGSKSSVQGAVESFGDLAGGGARVAHDGPGG